VSAGAPRSPDEVVVRELRWTDFDPIRETYYRLYDERERNPDLGITLFAHRPSYADEVNWFSTLYRSVLNGDAVVAVAERSAGFAGHCTVRRVGPSPESETAHVGELGILVDEAHRGQGVGRALLDRVLRDCGERFEVVRLSVFATNHRARRLYESFGFVRVGTLPGVIRRGDRYLDEDLMVKSLRPSPNR